MVVVREKCKSCRFFSGGLCHLSKSLKKQDLSCLKKKRS